MRQLDWAGLLPEGSSEQVGDDGFAVRARWCAGDGGIEAVEDEEVALGVVECGKGSVPLEVVHGGEGIHLVIFDLVPGDIPAGAVGLDADGKVCGTEVVADG